MQIFHKSSNPKNTQKMGRQGIKSFRREAKLKFRQTAKTIEEVRILDGWRKERGRETQ